VLHPGGQAREVDKWGVEAVSDHRRMEAKKGGRERGCGRRGRRRMRRTGLEAVAMKGAAVEVDLQG